MVWSMVARPAQLRNRCIEGLHAVANPGMEHSGMEHSGKERSGMEYPVVEDWTDLADRRPGLTADWHIALYCTESHHRNLVEA